LTKTAATSPSRWTCWSTTSRTAWPARSAAIWVTFVPCFLFVFIGAPYMEKLRGNKALSAALTGVTAAVVGVIANLGVYFAVHTLFASTAPWAWGPLTLELPDLASLRPYAVVLTGIAALLLFRLKISVLKTLGICAGLGLIAGLVGLPIT